MFRVYIADSLQVLTENTAKFAGGTVINARFYDMVTRQLNAEEKKSGEEIVVDIVTRAGLELA